MSWMMEAIVNAHNWWHGVGSVIASTKKTDNPLRLGILGAAAINPGALFDPVSTHPDCIIVGIAARSKAKAEAQIKKYKLTTARAYGSYDEILADPEIEAIYNPLPNGLHHEWTLKAVRAGKHVLLEKPIASNAQQARELQEASYASNKIILEAFHWRLHPAAHAVKQLVESGDYGAVQEVSARFVIPAGAIPNDDIRFQYSLAGGSSMDCTYVFSATSYYAVSDLPSAELEVLSAKPTLHKIDRDIDVAMKASYTLTGTDGSKVLCHTETHHADPWLFGVIPKFWEMATTRIVLENATITFPNFVGPWLNHSITVTDKFTNKVTKKFSQYTDGPHWGTRGQRWWTTYRYQLEAFVDGVRAVQSGERTVKEVDEGKVAGLPWVPLRESVAEMGIIDAVYVKAGLPVRK